jgi:chemotaxis family two-component system response regulator Rcp1
MNLKPNILIIEDNPGDARLISESLKEFNIPHNLYLAKDEVMAVQMLYNEGEYSDLSTPDLILLDMNLPKKMEKMFLER